MFLFGGAGGNAKHSPAPGLDAPQDADRDQLLTLLLEKEEELSDVNAKFEALRDALHREEEDDFEKAISEKNRVLEEQGSQIEALRKDNARLKEQVEQNLAPPPPVAEPAPAAGESEQVDVVDQVALKQLQASLDQALEQNSLQAAEIARASAENQELRQRLESTVDEARLSDSGEHRPSEEDLTRSEELRRAQEELAQLRAEKSTAMAGGTEPAAEAVAALATANQRIADEQERCAVANSEVVRLQEMLHSVQAELMELRAVSAKPVGQKDDAGVTLVEDQGAAGVEAQQQRLAENADSTATQDEWAQLRQAQQEFLAEKAAFAATQDELETLRQAQQQLLAEKAAFAAAQDELEQLRQAQQQLLAEKAGFAATQDELAQLRQAMQSMEEQLAATRQDAAQAKTSLADAVGQSAEASDRASQLQEALRSTEERLAAATQEAAEAKTRLEEATSHAVEASGKDPSARPDGMAVRPLGADGGDDGWDFDLDVGDATGSTAGQAVLQSELSELRENYRAASDQLVCLEREAQEAKDKLAALLEENARLHELQQAAAQRSQELPQGHDPPHEGGGGDDGWDFDLDLAHASPTEPKAEAAGAVHELAALRERLTKEESRVAETHKELERLQEAQDTANNLATTVQQRFLEEETKSATLQNELSQLQEQYQAARDQLGCSEREAQEAKDKLAASADEIARLRDAQQAEARRGQEPPHAAEGGNDGWDFDMDMGHASPTEPKTEAAGASLELAAMRERLAEEESKVAAAQKESERIQATLQSELSQLREQYQAARDQLGCSEREAQEAKDKLAASADEIARLRDMQQAEAQRGQEPPPAGEGGGDGWDFDMDMGHASPTELKTDTASASLELAAMRERLVEEESRVAAAQQESERVQAASQSELSQLREQYQAARDQLGCSEREAQEAKDRIAALLEDNARLKGVHQVEARQDHEPPHASGGGDDGWSFDLDLAHPGPIEPQKEAAEAAQDLAAIQERLKEEESRAAAARRELEQLQDSTNNQVLAVQQRLVEEETKSAALQSELSQLWEQHQTARDRLGSLEREAQEASDKLVASMEENARLQNLVPAEAGRSPEPPQAGEEGGDGWDFDLDLAHGDSTTPKMEAAGADQELATMRVRLAEEESRVAATQQELERRLREEESRVAAAQQEFERRLAEEESRAVATQKELERRLAEEESTAADARKELERHQEEVKAMREQLTCSEDATRETNEGMTVVTQEAARLREEVRKASEGLAAAEQDAAKLRQDVRQASEGMAAAEKEAGQLREDARKASEGLIAAEQEAARLREDARQASEGMTAAAQEAIQLRQDARKASEGLAAAEQEVARLRALIEAGQPHVGGTNRAQPAATPAAGDDGWDFDLDIADVGLSEPNAGPVRTGTELNAVRERLEAEEARATAAQKELQQSHEKLQATLDQLNRSKEEAISAKRELTSALEETARLQAMLEQVSLQEIPAGSQSKVDDASTAGIALSSVADSGGDGWDFDFDTGACEPQVGPPAGGEDVHSLRQRLAEEEAKLEATKTELQSARDQLTCAQKDASDARAALAEAQGKAVRGDGEDGWDFDVEAIGSGVHMLGQARGPASEQIGAAQQQQLTQELAEQKLISERMRNEVAQLQEALQAAQVQFEVSQKEAQSAKQSAAAEKEATIKESNSLWDLDFDFGNAIDDLSVKQGLSEKHGDGEQKLATMADEIAQLQEQLLAVRGQLDTARRDAEHAQQRLASVEEEATQLRTERAAVLEGEKSRVGHSAGGAGDGGGGWDVDDFDIGEVGNTGPQAAGTDTAGALAEAQQQLMAEQAASAAAKDELARLQEALHVAEQQLAGARQDALEARANFEVASKQSIEATNKASELQEALSRANDDVEKLRQATQETQVAAPVQASGPTTTAATSAADVGWDFDELDVVASAPEAVKPAVGDGRTEGWDDAFDFDIGEDAATPSQPQPSAATADALAAAQRQLAEEEARGAAARAEAERLDEALRVARGELAESQTELEEARKCLVEERSRASMADGEMARLQAALDDARRQPPASDDNVSSQAIAGVPNGGGAKNDDGWDFGFDVDDDDLDEKPVATPVASAPETKELQRLRTELAVLTGRLQHAAQELQAERAVHGEGAARALRAEVASLSQALAHERRERAQKEAQLKKQVREIQDQCVALQREHERQRQEQSVQSQKEEDQSQPHEALSEDNARLRRQRERARDLAQRLTQHTSDLAEEVSLLRAADTSGRAAGVTPSPLESAAIRGIANGRGGISSSPTRAGGDPERTLERHVPVRPGGTVNEDVALGSGLPDRHLGTQAVAEVIAPRPPDEVTSGWDVFDPDDQIERTGPEAVNVADAGPQTDLVGRGSAGGWEADAPEVSPGGEDRRGGALGHVPPQGHRVDRVDVDPFAEAGWGEFDPDDQTEHTTPMVSAPMVTAPESSSDQPANADVVEGGGWDTDFGGLLDAETIGSAEASGDGGAGAASASAEAPELSQEGGWPGADLDLEELLGNELC